MWFQDGRYAYLSTGMPDFEPTHPLDDQFVVIVDLDNPAQPQEVGRWWLPGTRKGDAQPPPRRHPQWDGGFRAHNVNVYPGRPDRAYVGYLDGGVVILDIADRTHPRLVSQLDYHPPMPGFTHTVLPLLDRGLLAVTDEAITDACQDAPKNLWIVHAEDERNPMIVAAAPLPAAEEFCSRGGRFGAHNIHENDPVEGVWKSEDILVGAFFNGGVRAFDIKDPFRPEEIAYLVPPAPRDSPVGAIQMNDVLVDERGVIYAIDRVTGGLYTAEFDL
ncbi:MAG: LVIVD repeat-containing protein [Nocardioidaceae bacterium]